MFKRLVPIEIVLLVLTGVAYAKAPVPATYTAHPRLIHEGKTDHPAGCLYARPKVHPITGSLAATFYPAVPQELPPIKARAFLFLTTAEPISVCAFFSHGAHLTTKIPSFVNVDKIGMGWWPVVTARLILKKWGEDQIRITGSLGNALLTGGAPGVVIFWEEKQFCSRKNEQDAFHCVDWKSWLGDLRKEVRESGSESD